MPMSLAPSLLASCGDSRVDDMVRGLIGSFEAAFPGRIRACYVEGSYADWTAVAASDIDLVIVFKDRFDGERERAAARRLGEQCSVLVAFELDLDLVDEAQLAEGAFPTLKLASRLLYGEDIRPRIPLLPIDTWTRERMRAAYWLIVKVFKRPAAVRRPLAYPRPDEEFYGYDQRTIVLPDGSQVRCTRDLIRVTGWAATALIALKAGIYVVRKHDCHEIYQRSIGDEWSDLLSNIYERCKSDWNYAIPEQPHDRRQLRAICARTLEFENHFLAIFREFVLGELRGGDAKARHDAAWLLGQIPYEDDAIREALYAFS
jgi:predicted nucleotidyltransferase